MDPHFVVFYREVVNIHNRYLSWILLRWIIITNICSITLDLPDHYCILKDVKRTITDTFISNKKDWKKCIIRKLCLCTFILNLYLIINCSCNQNLPHGTWLITLGDDVWWTHIQSPSFRYLLYWPHSSSIRGWRLLTSCLKYPVLT